MTSYRGYHRLNDYESPGAEERSYGTYAPFSPRRLDWGIGGGYDRFTCRRQMDNGITR